MLQPNLGLLDRYVRLAGGLMLLAGGLEQRRSSIARSMLVAIGAMKVTEGVTGWCPVMHLCGVTESPSKPTMQSHSSNSAMDAHPARDSQAKQHDGSSAAPAQPPAAHHDQSDVSEAVNASYQ